MLKEESSHSSNLVFSSTVFDLLLSHCLQEKNTNWDHTKSCSWYLVSAEKYGNIRHSLFCYHSNHEWSSAANYLTVTIPPPRGQELPLQTTSEEQQNIPCHHHGKHKFETVDSSPQFVTVSIATIKLPSPTNTFFAAINYLINK